MKTKLLFLMFIINIASFGQGITVSTSYTTDQLVNDVLMNSPCVQGYNIQSQGNCGIAYFNIVKSCKPASCLSRFSL